MRRSEDVYGDVASMSLQGSIFWMAPEVVAQSKRGYSAKVDIWSLGCVALEMLAGRRPWSDQEAVEAMFKLGAERRAPPIPPDVRLSKAAVSSGAQRCGCAAKLTVCRAGALPAQLLRDRPGEAADCR